MKAIAEIVVAVIFLASSCYLASRLINGLKKEALIKVEKGLSPLSVFANNLTSPIKQK
jgi:hypothetical protein